MKLIIQYVSSAQVEIDNRPVGEISRGFLVLAGIHQLDNRETVDEMVEKLVKLRVIPDKNGKINLSIKDIGGEILAVSQFTLFADTKKGNRPYFGEAADQEKGKDLFDHFVSELRTSGIKVETGIFGAKMDVSLINSGPITIILE